ncbi:MAG: tRNA 2-thiouridine(34) synthase MnmA [Desulfobacteraceae bacterium 4572_35.1]|nr:MAG: tRNA 2-thiouridine(34) synthase MnmA [Desulfobacteraceae bacterium 4572_35.1]
MKTQQRVVVALSGGVDSAATAALLIEQGYEVIGVHMQLLDADKFYYSDDAARQVATELGIEFHHIDCRAQFSDQIIDNFCSEYRKGRTPNPCVLCNKQLKFGKLLQVCTDLGGDYLATGHYACIDKSGDSPLLRRGKDLLKDQSYFLFTLTADQLSRVFFPLADLTKQQVKQIAKRWNLSARHKAESQDICFIPDNDYVSFLEHQNLDLPGGGDIIYVDGTTIGHHNGIHRHTIGQRRGLGIAWSEPLYVTAIDAENNCILVGEKSCLQVNEMIVDNVMWSRSMDNFPVRVDCRIRYRHREAIANITKLSETQVMVTFEQSQTGVTPGQAAVFYQDDCVVGGGWIK